MGHTRPKAECTKRPNASQPRRHSRTHFTALHGHGFAAESRPHTCRIPTAIQWKHEGSRIVHPKIPDLAVAARRFSAAQRTHPYITRSDRTLSPGHACAARRKRPSHADGEIALRCRPRTPPSPQLGAEAAPIQIIACEAGTEWLRRGETAAYLPDSDSHPMPTRRVPNRQPDDPGPCRRCASALSSAADAPTHISLGSHAKSGPTMRRSPRRAVPCGHRHGASLSATDATNPAARRRGSNHPDHRMRGWNRVLPAGENRIANGWGLLRRGSRADGEPRIGSSGQTGSGKRYQRLSAPQDLRSVGCARIARQTWGAHGWRIGMRVLRCGMHVRPS
jgi:hypothetical protein